MLLVGGLICIFGMCDIKLAVIFFTKNTMKKFSEILATLENADHVQHIALFNNDDSVAGVIENKPGSQGSIKVYHHLYQKWGVINGDAAREGLAIYAEHTADAQNNPGKHPNIDRLLEIMASGKSLRIEISKDC